MEQNEKSKPPYPIRLALRHMMENFDNRVELIEFLIRFLIKLQLFFLTISPDKEEVEDFETYAILLKQLGRTGHLNCSGYELQKFFTCIGMLIVEVPKGHPPESFLSSKEKEEYDKEIKEEVFLGTINFLIRESFEPFESASFSKSEKKRLDNLRERFKHANHRSKEWIDIVIEFRNNIENGRTKAPPGLLKFIHKYLALTVTT